MIGWLKNRVLCVLLVTSLGVGVNACAHAPAAPTLATQRNELESAYAQIAASARARDLEGVMHYLTNDVEWRMSDGSVQHRAEIESSMRDYLANRPEGRFEFELVSVVANGAALQAEVRLYDGEQVMGWSDTWVKSEGTWQNKLGIEHLVK